jgi:hypothetical protein
MNCWTACGVFSKRCARASADLVCVSSSALPPPMTSGGAKGTHDSHRQRSVSRQIVHTSLVCVTALGVSSAVSSPVAPAPQFLQSADDDRRTACTQRTSAQPTDE